MDNVNDPCIRRIPEIMVTPSARNPLPPDRAVTYAVSEFLDGFEAEQCFGRSTEKMARFHRCGGGYAL
jgi:hypothetical protein